MPDITMCNNGNCPKRGSCYRYCATPAPQCQGYATFHFDPLNGDCNEFIQANCCEQSQYQWVTNGEDGETFACLYCAKEYEWASQSGRWRRSLHG